MTRLRSIVGALAVLCCAPAVARAELTLNGEVVVVQGDEDIVAASGAQLTLRSLPALSRKVIEQFGDHFEAMTVWMTFDDPTLKGEAYETTVKNEVLGLGTPPVDLSRSYGSNGVLRSVLNMKLVGLRAGDARSLWDRALETWGQESAHRWLMFFSIRHPRTGKISDALMGRDCAHYNQFVDTQASIHDGFAWTDNRDGSFSWTERTKRYGNLDLYGMGLLAADEMPPFFIIENIPNYSPPACMAYDTVRRPSGMTVMGTRLDVSIDDVVAANGERVPRAHELRQDYWREVEVILTRPTETWRSPTPMGLADRLNKARLWWEEWNRGASRNRLVMCTQVSADCGDPRSDVTALVLDAAGKGPTAGPVALDVEVSNTGKAIAGNVHLSVEVPVGGKLVSDAKDLGTIEPGTKRTQSFALDLHTIPCGTEVTVKAATQSDVHYHRLKTPFLVGTKVINSDGFEADSGWTVDPDGTDTTAGAKWERGEPEATEVLRTLLQPGGARTGHAAWVTGAAAVVPGQSTFVKGGKTTLASPSYDATPLREPLLRYWMAFAGVRATADGAGIEPSPDSSLTVLARNAGVPGDAGAATGWVEIDRAANQITKGWVQRSVSLPAELWGKGTLQFRFVVADGNAMRGGVEAAIDDLELTSKVAGCFSPPGGPAAVVMPSDGAGCGCRLGGGDRDARRGALCGLLAVALAARLTRRRRFR